MAVTVSVLENLDPTAFKHVGFDDALSRVGNAEDSFGDISRVVGNGQAWTGEGQPQAASVMVTNLLALEAAKLQMRAGISATDGLTTALLKAKRELAAVRSELAPDEDIAEDGTVTAKDEVVPGVEGTYDVTNDGLTERVQKILSYTESADLTAAGLLNRIANIKPKFVGNASQAATAYNTAMVALAHATVKDARLSEIIWRHLNPDSLEFDGSADLRQELKELAYQGWAGVQSGGTQALYELAGPGLTAATVAYGTAWFPPVAIGLGIVTLGGLLWALTDALGGDDGIEKGPDGVEDPVNKLGVAPVVDDPDLQDILDDFYLDPDSALGAAGFRTVVDGVILQRAGAEGLPDGEDYVAQAESLRSRLQDFMDAVHKFQSFGGDHQFPEDYGLTWQEIRLARQHLKALNSVLGG